MCPGFSLSPPTQILNYLSPRSCLNLPLPIPPQQNPALASSLLQAKHSVPNSQHPHPHSLPELEDDASGHENNDDGDGNCDIELGVHT